MMCRHGKVSFLLMLWNFNTNESVLFCIRASALAGYKMIKLYVHLVTGLFFLLLFFSFSLFPLHISLPASYSSPRTKAKCLAASQIKGLLLPPRKRWKNKHGWLWNQPYLLSATDSHICAAPLLCLPHSCCGELGKLRPSASRLPLPESPPGRSWLAPRLPTRWWIQPWESEVTRGGEAAGVATAEPEDEGQMWSAAPALSVHL